MYPQLPGLGRTDHYYMCNHLESNIIFHIIFRIIAIWLHQQGLHLGRTGGGTGAPYEIAHYTDYN